jgi:hypothetical protein
MREKEVEGFDLGVGGAAGELFAGVVDEVVGVALGVAERGHVLLNALLADEAIRVEAAFEGYDLYFEVLFGEEGDGFFCGGDAGGVGVEVDDDALGEAAEEANLHLGESSAGGGDDVFYPGHVDGDAVHLAFDEERETERVLLRVLVLPEDNPARILAATQLIDHPEWYESLPSAALLEALSNAPAPTHPLDAAPDEPSRHLLARTLQYSDDSAASSNSQSPTEQVENALHALAHRQLERRQRELRTLIAEADRRGDQEMLRSLTAEKLQIDRKLREH